MSVCDAKGFVSVGQRDQRIGARVRGAGDRGRALEVTRGGGAREFDLRRSAAQ